MKPRLVIHPRADLDQFESFSYLANGNPPAARRFLEAIAQILPVISENPEAGNRYLNAQREDEDWRYVRVPGFKNYFVFYRITESQTEIVRIVHGSRDLDAIFRVL